MRVGVVFPQTEIGADPYYIKDFAQAAEELGFAHILPTTMCLARTQRRGPTGKRLTVT